MQYFVLVFVKYEFMHFLFVSSVSACLMPYNNFTLLAPFLPRNIGPRPFANSPYGLGPYKKISVQYFSVKTSGTVIKKLVSRVFPKRSLRDENLFTMTQKLDSKHSKIFF